MTLAARHPLGMAPRAMTPLRRHVAPVVGSGSEEQVIRPAAWRVIAVMKDVYVVRYRLVGQLVGEAMGLDQPLVYADRPVAVLVRAALPLKAVAGQP
jgi:hypothetical protein